MKEKKDKQLSWQWIVAIIIVILIVIAVVIYFSSLGKVNLIDSIENKLIKRNKWIEHRIRKLNSLHLKKADLLARLNNYEQRIFLFARILAVIVFLTINGLIFSLCGATSFYDRLECALNVDQALVLIYLCVVFVFTKKFSDLSFVVKLAHLKIRRIVYRNFENIEENLEKIKLEIQELEGEKKLNEEKLKEKLEEKEKQLTEKF